MEGMQTERKSLKQIFPDHYEIPALLSVATLLLIFGLFLPIITLEELILWKSTFSVLTGIGHLFHESHYILGVIVMFFSVFFPITKLSALCLIWFCKISKNFRDKVIEWLGILGKWSMLDVFVVAIMIIITKISHFAHAEARIGIYFFGTSIILTMITTERIDRFLKSKQYAENHSIDPGISLPN